MDEIMKSHVIDPVLLRADSFPEFYTVRKGELLTIVERAMGKTSSATAVVADDDEGDDEESEAT
jgi:hypothetical protein